MSILIRPVQEADLPALEWGREYLHLRRIYRQVYHAMRRGQAMMWVAEHPQQGVVGQVFVQLISRRHDLADGASRAYLFGLRVRPAWRGQGIGTRLIRTVEEYVRELGYSRLTLVVGRDNLTARRLYEKLGYGVVALEEGRWAYLDHRGELREMHEPGFRMEKQI